MKSRILTDDPNRAMPKIASVLPKRAKDRSDKHEPSET
jgi:hypothetical protein